MDYGKLQVVVLKKLMLGVTSLDTCIFVVEIILSAAKNYM